jgi:hypothetical protein
MCAVPSSRRSVVVVGGGFAGFYAARTLERLPPADDADLAIVSQTDHLSYCPLPPEVAAGRLDPRRIVGPLHSLRRTRVVQATVDGVDVNRRIVHFFALATATEELAWDRLALVTGSITRSFPTPGLESHALGFTNLVEGGVRARARASPARVRRRHDRGYHLYALPGAANRLRVAAGWAVNLISRPFAVQLGQVDPEKVRLTAEAHPAPGRSAAASDHVPGPTSPATWLARDESKRWIPWSGS